MKVALKGVVVSGPEKESFYWTEGERYANYSHSSSAVGGPKKVSSYWMEKERCENFFHKKSVMGGPEMDGTGMVKARGRRNTSLSSYKGPSFILSRFERVAPGGTFFPSYTPCSYI